LVNGRVLQTVLSVAWLALVISGVPVISSRTGLTLRRNFVAGVQVIRNFAVWNGHVDTLSNKDIRISV
jgi:hypothetical protein